MPAYLFYIAYTIGIIFFIWLWLKFTPTRLLLAAITNIAFGVAILSDINAQTAGLPVELAVASVLIIFGIWGFALWTKYTTNSYKDQVQQTEAVDNWWSTVKAFDIILVIGLILRMFIIQPFMVEGPSMENNFKNKEYILVDKVSYKLREPIRGEVVIFKAPKNPQDDYIKRMIGLPGDEISSVKGKVYVDNQIVDESFLSDSGKTPENSDPLNVTVGENEYFVLGDNRPHSSDSREWGLVPKENMIGRAVVAVYPIELFGLIKTPQI
jgi:signal peptidase I